MNYSKSMYYVVRRDYEYIVVNGGFVKETDEVVFKSDSHIEASDMAIAFENSNINKDVSIVCARTGNGKSWLRYSLLYNALINSDEYKDMSEEDKSEVAK